MKKKLLILFGLLVCFAGITVAAVNASSSTQFGTGEDKYYIDMGECTGCATCVSVCKAEAIYPTLDIYQINQEKCTRCGECKEVCPNDAIKTW